MTTFQPIYITAQALDNVSDNDFYEITLQEVKPLTDIETIQNKAYEMIQVIKQSEENNNRITEKLKNIIQNKFQHLRVYKANNLLLLKFGTTDKDIVNRESNIDVLLNLEGVNSSNIKEYIQYFYKGFIKFNEVTNRHPLDIEKITSLDFAEILNTKDPKVFLDALPEPFNNKSVLIVIAIIVVIMLFVAFK